MLQKMDFALGGGGDVINPQLIKSDNAPAGSFSITGVKGKKLIVYTWLTSTSSQIAYNAKDLTSVVGGTATVIGRLSTSAITTSPYRAGTFTLIEATSDTVSFSISNGNSYCQIISIN